MKATTRAALIASMVTFFATSLLWVGLLAGVYVFFSTNTPDFRVELEAPEQVPLGETFTLRVKVWNPTDEVLEVGSIDIYHSLLEGFEVVSVDPAPVSQENIMDFRTFYLSAELPPQERREFQFTLKATRSGVWSGDVDTCTPHELFVTHRALIRVD